MIKAVGNVGRCIFGDVIDHALGGGSGVDKDKIVFADGFGGIFCNGVFFFAEFVFLSFDGRLAEIKAFASDGGCAAAHLDNVFFLVECLKIAPHGRFGNPDLFRQHGNGSGAVFF